MNKILLEVTIPIMEQTFDVFVPVNKKVSGAIILINQAINELTSGTYSYKKESILCNATNGAMYDSEKLVRDSGLENGSKVIII